MSAPKLFRYPNEAAGALVLLALLLFIGSVLQSGRLNDWFETGAKLKVILPEEGLFGLSRGGKVEILGTQAGVVEEVVIARDQKIHAIVEIQKEMKRFVRRDSRAIIRKQFGVAGAAYLEISRGRGEPLDWEHAVIKARAEQAPTESMGELLTELRTNVMPLLKKARQLVASMNEITGTIASGEGAIGRLVTNDRIALEMESLLSRMDTSTRQLPS
jgi:phospholipid/cholesterol/gamma-HCH transport system substrate-binding protein